MIREDIVSAFFALLQTIPGVNTFSRRLKHWDDVQPDAQPALYLTCDKQTVIQDTSGLTPVWKIQLTIYLYVFNADVTSTPSIALNNFLDVIEGMLVPTVGPLGFPNTVQTLGGLVRYAWISGPIETDEGVLGDQAIAIIPIEIEYV